MISHPLAALLFDMLLRGALLLSATFAVAWILRRTSAACRHLILASAMILLLVLPVLLWSLPRWNALPENMSFAPAVFARHESTPQASDNSVGRSDAQKVIASRTTAIQIDLFDLLVMIWVIGVAICLLPMVGGLWAIHRRSHRWEELPEDSTAARIFSKAVQQLGIRQRIRLFVAEECQMPMTIGTLKPTIVLPTNALDWPEQQLRATLLHELAHIQRMDCLISLLCRISAAMQWPNPLAWLAVKQIDLERERACDDAVLRLGTAQSQYARELLTVATGKPGFALAVAMPFARKATLERRIKDVLGLNKNRSAATLAQLLIVTIVAIALIIPLATIGCAQTQHPTAAAQSQASATPSGPTDGKPAMMAVAERLKYLGLASIMYSNDHNGTFPPTVGDTLKYSDDKSASQYLTPTDARSISAPSPLTREWINEHTSFEYLTPSVSWKALPAPAETVMMHTKLDQPFHNNRSQPCVVALFADGHVEIMTVDRATPRIDATKKTVSIMRGEGGPR